MTTTETYNLLSAVVTFRESYKRLQSLYSKSEEADLCAMYPLGQIDLFDQNTTNAIIAWLNHHAVKLMNALPDRIINPACVDCLIEHKYKCGITPSGACSFSPTCVKYPYITYDRNMLLHFLKQQNLDADISVYDDMDDTAIRTLYHNLLTKFNIQEDVE